MTILPEYLVKGVYDNLCRINGEWQPIGPNDIKEVLTAALPFLSVQGAVKKLNGDELEEAIRLAEIGEYLYNRSYSYGDGYSEPREYGIEWQWQQTKPNEFGEGALLGEATRWHKEQAEDGVITEASKLRRALRILSALEPSAAQERCRDCDGYNCDDGCAYPEPSAARELALEEHLHAIEQQLAVNLGYFHDEKRFLLETLQAHITTRIAAIRVLSSPDHANAGKVEGDVWHVEYEVYSEDEWQAASTDLDGALDYAVMYAADGLENIAIHEVRRRIVTSAPASEGAE